MGRSLSNNVGYPYVSFKVKGFGLTVNFDDERPDYFSSLEHKRYVDQANTATVKLAFAPRGSGISGNPNLLEAAISDSGRCEFSYGFAGLKSKVYRGLVYSYQVGFNEGFLTYTLQLVSEAVMFNYDKIKDSFLNIRKKGETGGIWYTPKSEDEINQEMEDFKKSVEKEINSLTPGTAAHFYAIDNKQTNIDNKKQELENENEEVKKKAKENSEIDSNEVLETMNKIVENYCGDKYVFDKENSAKDFIVRGDGGVNVQNIAPIKALQTIASALLDSGGSLSTVYKIFISDSSSKNSKGVITLKKFASKSGAVYQFEWGSKDTDVISWSPSYDGSMAIFTSSESNKGKKKKDKYTKKNISSQVSVVKDSDGNEQVTMTATEIPKEQKKKFYEGTNWADSWDSIEGYHANVDSITEFEQRANYPYKGTLEVLGASDELVKLIDSRISIIPLINGKRHHTAGIYTVTGITDKVNSQGFTTVLEVVRYASVTGSDAYSGLKDDESTNKNSEGSSGTSETTSDS